MNRILLICVIAIGCKQEEGERCQVDDDCLVGTCNRAKGICQTSGGGEFDASVPDAPPDAPPDAM